MQDVNNKEDRWGGGGERERMGTLYLSLKFSPKTALKNKGLLIFFLKKHTERALGDKCNTCQLGLATGL